jgi:hypothetical protein
MVSSQWSVVSCFAKRRLYLKINAENNYSRKSEVKCAEEKQLTTDN